MICTSLLAVVLGQLSTILPEVMVGSQPLVRGALIGRHVYGFGLADRTNPQDVRPSRLAGRATLLRNSLMGGPCESYDVNGFTSLFDWPSRQGPAPVRWQLAGNTLYFAYYQTDRPWGGEKVPRGSRLEAPGGGLSGLRLSDHMLAACRVGPEPADRGQLNRRHHAVTEANRGVPLVFYSPLDALFGRRGGAALPQPDLWRTHFDFHLGPIGRVELFVSTPRRLSWHVPAPGGSQPTADEGVRGEGNWTRRGAFTSGWDGPFYVAADGADRHFVVPGGRVFTLPADAQPGTALVKTWDGDPVLALVHDADAGKSYAFTRTHYFHITAKPDPKPHALQAFPGATAEEALDTVAKCGWVIRGLK